MITNPSKHGHFLVANERAFRMSEIAVVGMYPGKPAVFIATKQCNVTKDDYYEIVCDSDADCLIMFTAIVNILAQEDD